MVLWVLFMILRGITGRILLLLCLLYYLLSLMSIQGQNSQVCAQGIVPVFPVTRQFEFKGCCMFSNPVSLTATVRYRNMTMMYMSVRMMKILSYGKPYI